MHGSGAVEVRYGSIDQPSRGKVVATATVI